MTLMTPLRNKGLVAAGSVVAFLLISLGVALLRSPIGYFDSTAIIGHHSDDDVLSFSDGTVTWKTCCGDKRIGTYSRSRDGTWIWEDVWGTKNPKTNVIILHPGLFSLTCIDTNSPERVWELTRRILPPRSIDEDGD